MTDQAAEQQAAEQQTGRAAGEFVPNAAQALRLKILADDGSPYFGEKLANVLLVHDAAAQTGADICPCGTCDPAGEHGRRPYPPLNMAELRPAPGRVMPARPPHGR